MTGTDSDASRPGPGFDIVPLSGVDQKELLDLLKTSLSSDGVTRKTEDFWRWKHEDNAFGRSIGCAAVTHDCGALVALRPLMAWVFTTPSQAEVRAFRPVDTVTHPSWRGRGLFSKLTKFAIKQIDSGDRMLIFNTPNENSLPGYEKMGWLRSDHLDLLARPGSVIRTVRSLVAGMFSRRASDGWSIDACGRILRSREMTTRQVDELVDFCSASEAVRDPVGLRTKRTKPFLKWRYFMQPNVDYGFSLVRDSAGGIVSVVVLRPEIKRWACAALLVDVFTKDGSIESIRTAIRTARRNAMADVFVAHAAKGSNERIAMTREFFLPVKSKILAARIVGVGGEASVLDATAEDLDWDLSLADIEIF